MARAARRLVFASLILSTYASTTAFGQGYDVYDNGVVVGPDAFGPAPIGEPSAQTESSPLRGSDAAQVIEAAGTGDVQALLVADGDPVPSDEGPAIPNETISNIDVIFIRHGQSEWNVKKAAKPKGKNDTPDVLLTANGIRDAIAAREALRTALSGKSVALLTSNLARAQLTGVIATGAAVDPWITSSMQETSGGKDAESALAAYTARTLQPAEIANMRAAGMTDAEVAAVTTKYAAANSTNSKGNHMFLQRAAKQYLGHFPKYLVQAYNRVKSGPYAVVLAGHSHWWVGFVEKATTTDSSCEIHPKNGQAIAFKLSTKVKPAGWLAKESMSYTVTECRSLAPGSEPGPGEGDGDPSNPED